MPTVLFAGGGSGGHIYPGLAVVERLSGISPDARAIFACSNRVIDKRILSGSGVEYRPLPASPVSIRPRAAARFLAGFARSRGMTRDLLAEMDVDAVLALGGFVAAPAVAAARDAGVPTVLLNLDAHPGKANRWLARRCDHVLTAVPLSGYPRFEQVVGMPVRRQALAGDDAGACRASLGLDPDRPTLLVVGGSQGASSLNAFATAFATRHGGTLDGWQVLHLAGGDGEAIGAAWRDAGVDATVLDYLEEMGRAWGAADLAVSRAGAGSVAEVALNAVPTLFLPYPFHRDRHQHLNAEPLERRGGAVIAEDRVDADLNLDDAGRTLAALLADAPRRAAMAAALREHAPGDAAETTARLLLGICEKTHALAGASPR